MADGTVKIDVELDGSNIQSDVSQINGALDQIKGKGDDVKDSLDGIGKLDTKIKLGVNAEDSKAKIEEISKDISKLPKEARVKLEAAAETVGIKNFDHMLTLLPKKAVTQLLTEASTTGAVDFKRLLASIPKEQRTEIELRDNASPALRQIRQGMDDVKGASTSLKTVMMGTFAGNAILAGISAITNGLKEMTAQAITSYDAINTFDKTMTFAGFGKKQIHEASEELRDYSRATIYNVGEMSNTAATLAANGVKNFTGVTKSLGNLVAVSGGGADAMKSASLALTQIVGAGKMYTGDWNQFINMIPGASKKIQDQLKKNGAYTGNFRDAMSKGQITAKEFVKALNELGSTDVAKKAATDTSKFSTAWQGMQESIQDGILNIMDAMGTKGITGAISGFGNVVYDVFDGIAKSIKVLSKAFGEVGKVLSPVTRELGKIGKAANVGGIFKVAASGVAIFAGSFLTLLTTVNKLRQLRDTVHIVSDLTGAFKRLGGSLVKHPYLAVAAALITLAAALIYAYNHSKTFREWVNKNKEPLMTLAKVVGIAVAAFAGFKTMSAVVGGLMKVASVVKKVSGAIKGLSAVSKVVSGIKALGAAFGLITNPVGLVIAAIVAVAAAFVLLYKHNAKFRSWVNGLAKHAKAGAKRMADGFKSGVNSAKKHLDKLGKDINSAAKNAKSGAKKIGDNIRNGVKSGVDKTKSSFDKLKKNLSNMNKDAKIKTRQMAKTLQSAFEKLPSGVKKAVRNIENNVKGIVDVVKDMTRLVRAIARGDWKEAWEAFKDVVGDSWKLISNLTKNSINGVQDLVDAGLDAIKSSWNSAWSSVADFFSSIWNRIKADAKAGINAVIDIINGGISGINSVISFFGGSARVGSIKHLKTGTSANDKDEFAVVNDEEGDNYREAIVRANGKVEIPHGRNQVVWLNRGDQVIPARETAQLFNLNHYAHGRNAEKLKELASYLANPLGKLREIFNRPNNGRGVFQDMGAGVIRMAPTWAEDWFVNQLRHFKELFEAEDDDSGSGRKRKKHANGGWSDQEAIFGEIPGEPEVAINPARETADNLIVEAIRARAMHSTSGMAGKLASLLGRAKANSHPITPSHVIGGSVGGGATNAGQATDSDLNISVVLDSGVIARVTYPKYKAMQARDLVIRNRSGATPIGRV